MNKAKWLKKAKLCELKEERLLKLLKFRLRIEYSLKINQFDLNQLRTTDVKPNSSRIIVPFYLLVRISHLRQLKLTQRDNRHNLYSLHHLVSSNFLCSLVPSNSNSNKDSSYWYNPCHSSSTFSPSSKNPSTSKNTTASTETGENQLTKKEDRSQKRNQTLKSFSSLSICIRIVLKLS